jgi:PKD repeat protein
VGASGIAIVRYATADLTATGGTITTDGAYTVHTFTSSGTLDVTDIPVAPVADFSGTPTSGTAPLSVAFTDLSTNTPTSWLWEKNDGSGWSNFDTTPTAQNPTEDFAAGTWSVRLTATNAAGSDTETKTDYVVATAAATTDTHDGYKKPWHQRLEFAPEEIEAHVEEYRAEPESLRADVQAIGNDIEDFAPELTALVANAAMLREIARLALAEHQRAIDEDEEDVMLLVLH